MKQAKILQITSLMNRISDSVAQNELIEQFMVWQSQIWKGNSVLHSDLWSLMQLGWPSVERCWTWLCQMNYLKDLAYDYIMKKKNRSISKYFVEIKRVYFIAPKFIKLLRNSFIWNVASLTAEIPANLLNMYMCIQRVHSVSDIIDTK